MDNKYPVAGIGGTLSLNPPSRSISVREAVVIALVCSFIAFGYVLPGAQYWNSVSKYALTAIFFFGACVTFRDLNYYRLAFYVATCLVYVIVKWVVVEDMLEPITLLVQLLTIIFLFSSDLRINRIAFDSMLIAWALVVFGNLVYFRGLAGEPSLGHIDRNISALFLLCVFYVGAASNRKWLQITVIACAVIIQSRNLLVTLLIYYVAAKIHNRYQAGLRRVGATSFTFWLIVFLSVTVLFTLYMVAAQNVSEDSYTGLGRLLNLVDASNFERALANVRAIDFLFDDLKVLLFGSRAGYFDNPYDLTLAHNAFMKDLVKLGVLGFLLKYAIVGREASRLRSSNSLFAFIVSGMFFSSFLDGFSILGGVMFWVSFMFGDGNRPMANRPQYS